MPVGGPLLALLPSLSPLQTLIPLPSPKPPPKNDTPPPKTKKGSGKLGLLASSTADVVGLDWSVGMADARAALGPLKVQGNVDPMLLFAPEATLTAAVNECLLAAGPRGHILNVGHGVPQGCPESGVALFCDLARASGELFKKHGATGPAAPKK